MTTHLFHAKTLTGCQHRNDFSGTKQYVVAEGSTRSVAAGKAMRKVYALEARGHDLHSVELEWLGTVEFAR